MTYEDRARELLDCQYCEGTGVATRYGRACVPCAGTGVGMAEIYDRVASALREAEERGYARGERETVERGIRKAAWQAEHAGCKCARCRAVDDVIDALRTLLPDDTEET